ncbi:MAG TPA: response regulator [Thermoanaerobaculia bacterium]
MTGKSCVRGAGGPALLGIWLFLAAGTAVAQGEWPQAGLWKSRPGDDLRWAHPGYDDAAWRAVPLPATWREQGYAGLDGPVWFRRVVTLDGEARLAARRGELAILLGPPRHGGYQVYAGGRLLGASPGWSGRLYFPFQEVFRVPREAVGEDGRLALALRARRVAWRSDMEPDSAVAGNILVLGDDRTLRDRAELSWSRTLTADLPFLFLALLFVAVGAYNLLLYWRRRRQIEHLWFGLLALCFAANAFASSYWVYEATRRYGVAVRASDLTGHLLAMAAVQFLWTFFSRPISRPLRAYQLSHGALALFVALVPDVRLVVASHTFRSLWLAPLLVLAVVLIAREAWRGDQEARTLSLGVLILVAAVCVELAGRIVPGMWQSPVSLAPFGFGAVLVAMSFSLASRFRRIHDELDRLRLNLEAEVRERTLALERAKEEALAASRVKGEFLANMSHEIRTPMNGVIGTTTLLLETPLTPEQSGYVETIRTSGEALLALINDVLDFSRMESGKVEIERAPFNLQAVIEESLGIVAPLAGRQGLALRHAIAEGTPEALVGDHARTRQILVNLLGNAVKFTPWGEVTVSLSARRLNGAIWEAHFAVADTGVGIAAEDLDRLFIAFQQLDGSLARQHGGTGLGLAISKRLTELMGGRIWAESAVGQGSTFHFTITGVAAAAAPPRPRTLAGGVDRGLARRHPLRILLAEDHAVNRKVMIGLLGHLGYEADLAGNGLEVLEALERRPYDVILMDIQMPDMDGLEVTRRIRQLAAERQPRIIALTAHAMAGDRERCLEAGMDAYLTKPVRIVELQAALAEASPRPPSPLDPETLEALRNLSAGEDLAGALIETYLATSAADFADARQGAEESRWPEVGRAVHRLKGSSSILGVSQVAAVCQAIEERVRAEETEELASLLKQLDEELGKARAALEEVARGNAVSPR